MHTVLLDRAGYVIQKWNGTRVSSLDPRAYAGQLLEVEGDVAPGHQYKDGRFWMVPPRVTSDEILAETDRRLAVFPPELQRQLASLGGQFTVTMFEYVRDVQMRASLFLAMDSAPADFADDKHWPALPDLSIAPVALARPETMTVAAVQPSVPVEVRVIVEGPQSASVSVPERVSLPAVIEHVPAGKVEAMRADPVETYDTEDDLMARKIQYLGAVEKTYDTHRNALPETHLDTLMKFGLEATACHSIACIDEVEQRTIAFIEGRA